MSSSENSIVQSLYPDELSGGQNYPAFNQRFDSMADFKFDGKNILILKVK